MYLIFDIGEPPAQIHYLRVGQSMTTILPGVFDLNSVKNLAREPFTHRNAIVSRRDASRNSCGRRNIFKIPRRLRMHTGTFRSLGRKPTEFQHAFSRQHS
ncbi:MAG: hypothetical protein WDM89_01315 [Rhizomicrobium sp.]